MTIEKQDILADFYAGNSKIISVTVSKQDGSAKDLSQCEVTYVLINQKGDVVLRKSSNLPDHVTISGVTNEIASVFLSPDDTDTLHGTFTHHMNIVDENGYEETVMTGKVRIFQSFAVRYRFTNLSAYVSGG